MAEKPKAHDETPAHVDDHPFEPRGQWWSLCKHCGLAQAAHSSSTIDIQTEIQRDHERQAEWRKAELKRAHEGGRARIGYYSDDTDDD